MRTCGGRAVPLTQRAGDTRGGVNRTNTQMLEHADIFVFQNACRNNFQHPCCDGYCPKQRDVSLTFRFTQLIAPHHHIFRHRQATSPRQPFTFMSGRGHAKNGKLPQVGHKGAPRRRRRVISDNISSISRSAIRRLARRGGVVRVSGGIYEESRGILLFFLENVLRDAVVYTEYAGRKTVSATDIVYTVKHRGQKLYGFGV